MRVLAGGVEYALHFFESNVSVSVTARLAGTAGRLAQARFHKQSFNPPYATELFNLELLYALGAVVNPGEMRIDFTGHRA